MMTTRLRRLNDEGMVRMTAFLESLKGDAPEQYPSSILFDPNTSEPLPVAIEIDQRSFPRRFEAADYLYRRFNAGGLDSPERDKGLWAWIALFWFDQLCPPDKQGNRKPGEIARWIPQLDNARRYYRHLLLGPYKVYATHSDDPSRAVAVLADPLHVATSEAFRTFVETPQFVISKAAMGALRILYYDKTSHRLRRGAGVKTAGGIRRLGEFLYQIDRTYDIHSLSEDDLLALLPREFDRFLAPKQSPYAAKTHSR